VRKFNAFIVKISFLLLLGPVLQGAPAAKKASPRPNILLITIDTLRPDHLGCYGSKTVLTPTIDALANRGVVFDRAFGHTPSTLASHTNILLGLTPNAHGVHDNSNFIVRDNFLTLAEWLKTLGYSTAAFVGAFPLDSRFGLVQGFDVYDDNYGSQGPTDLTFVERKGEVVVGKALEWLGQQSGPWFLWVHLFDPHQPYAPPEPFKSQYPQAPYDGEIAYVDSALKKLFGVLEERNLTDRTAVILTADHGESLGEHGESTHGYFAYNATIHVPLILSFPGIKPARVADNVSHIDIFPTVCGLLGEKEPAGLQGQSLQPLLQGRKRTDRPIYFEALTAYYNRGWAPLHGFILGRKKYMDSPIPEVYDLDKDFGELDNIAGKSDLPGLKKALDELMRSEASPLADGAGQRMDKASAEKLRSLGYLATSQVQRKKVFTAQDDLKTLLPLHAKWSRATAAYSAGRTEEGIGLLKEIIAQRKDFDLAYTYLADFYKEQGRRKDAEEVLREAYGNNPDSFRIIMAFGMFLIDEDRYDEAIPLLHESLGLIDFDPETWNYLGVAYWHKERYDDALKAYERALSIDKNYAIVFNNRGSLFLSLYFKGRKAEDLAKAAADFQKAVEIDPVYASAWNGLGISLSQTGDIDRALAAWKKAVDLKPNFAFALFNLGLGNLGRGNKAEALGYFTRYKNLAYASLPPAEKAKLDELIEKCR
jgi:arylsulfatase A-like enzyme/Flp pilus assembly protein TadD